MNVPTLEGLNKLEMALELNDFRKKCFDEVRAIQLQQQKALTTLRANKTRLINQIAELEEQIALKQTELGAWQLLCPNPKWLVDTRCSVPMPIVQSSSTGEGIPSVSGIYFVWETMEGKSCLYVGQSVCIRVRARLNGPLRRSDGNIHAGEFLSWLPVGVDDLDYAEAFYIGLLRPTRNKRTRTAEAKSRTAGRTAVSVDAGSVTGSEHDR